MNDLRQHSNQLHTTEMGRERIRKNLSIEVDDVAEWCKTKILDRRSKIERRGKNWYVTIDHCQITVNASSYTIITAHKTD